MKLHLASGNAHKVAEMNALAAASGLPFPLKICSARESGGMPPVVEDTGTFVGNARKKAVALRQQLAAAGQPDAWVLADDSGLCVDALGGAPGVESAYYAGPQGDSDANLQKLVETLRPVAGDRAAHYTCVLLLRGPGGLEKIFEAHCHGRLLVEPRGQGGFGYDPLFVPAADNPAARTFAELGDDFKNARSHRGLAWARLVQWLRENPPEG
ncbi:nucleoside-triphosphate diphosphatase [Opitutaceae bacterium TAV5]|nr:nucleoside-triphosphate diphosphatase [Opitutaceae bacterium TAV5]